MTPIDPSYREIPLTQGQVALVDATDYEWLMQWKWCAHWKPGITGYYAVRNVKFEGRTKTILMHRLIMGLEAGDKRKVDHREPSQTLDNRRMNLRVATNAENCHNIRKSKANTSGFKGVDKKRGKWRACIRVNGIRKYLGNYDTAEQAHEVYKKAATQFFGEFARES